MSNAPSVQVVNLSTGATYSHRAGRRTTMLVAKLNALAGVTRWVIRPTA